MKCINEENLILERKTFERTQIEKRMLDGHFKSIGRFELFIWDIEIFLQLQKKLGDKIILKGGAATQFYIPITSQRTSVDIDVICTATRSDLHKTLIEIENDFDGKDGFCKFVLHKPINPKLELDTLETYFMKVPSICNDKELHTTHGVQEVKIEFMFSKHKYPINQIKQPQLFALDTEHEFNILAFEYLFADKLTTLGPTTIGIPNDRYDEQFKQIYDVITLFLSNVDYVFSCREKIRKYYFKVASDECKIRNIPNEPDLLYEDMKSFINHIKDIEYDHSLQQMALNFQSLYLRKNMNRNKMEWAIVGYQLFLLINYLFNTDSKILYIQDIEDLAFALRFDGIRGPERGILNREVRNVLMSSFDAQKGLSPDLFKKSISRIIWELVSFVSFDSIEASVRTLLHR
ncbi:MAG: nucleotidyl transferase AbiEii/AbiGii toxin family protein [Oscillospiraceae bacterium]|jgi:hypothetical protein|nr:nucleotidyl transferase AbiEii/AbiGii toxin family protein [Oscillospiraceae bacterium]